MCRSAARVQNEPVPGMRGCAGGKGVLQSRIAAGELILRPPAEQLSGSPGEWEGKAGAGQVNRE